jgi:hypothetical protein
MTTRAGNQILAKLDSIAEKPALAVQRFTDLHAVVAIDAGIEIHHEQRVGLDSTELPASVEQF